MLPQGTVNIDIYDDRLNVNIGKTSFSAQSKGEIEIKSARSDQDLSIKASNINIDGIINTTLKSGVLNLESDQSSNIQSSGPMTIKGAIVNINPWMIGLVIQEGEMKNNR